MKRHYRYYTAKLVVAALLVLTCGSAWAQQQVSTFRSTTSQYGDWSVYCEQEDMQAESCVMTLKIRSADSNRAILEANFARTESGTQMTLVLPLGVYLPNGVELEVVDWDKAAYPISFCNQGGCFVNQMLEPEFLDLLRKKEKADLTIWTTASEKVHVPFSINGFLDAHKQLK